MAAGTSPSCITANISESYGLSCINVEFRLKVSSSEIPVQKVGAESSFVKYTGFEVTRAYLPPEKSNSGDMIDPEL